MTLYDKDGFLGGKIQAWIDQHRRTYQLALSLAERLNRESHTFIDGRTTNFSDARELTITILFVRLMELYQGLLLTVDRGMRAPTRILLRSFLEAFFHFAAIHKDPTYLDDYLDQFEYQRKSLVNRMRRTDHQSLESLRRAIDRDLIEEIERIDVRRVNIEDLARRAGWHNVYVTAYAILSGAVHSSAADLEIHLNYDSEKGRIVGFHYGPTDVETLRTVCLAGMTMAEALKLISADFSEDRTEFCDQAIESFNSLLPKTEEGDI